MIWGALVIVPVLITAAFLLRGARRSQAEYAARLEQAALVQGRESVRGVRGHLQQLRTETAEALRSVPATAWLESLPAWSDQDATIRNVFVWEPPDQVLYPTEATGLTRDEEAFLRRYADLLSGRVPWSLATVTEEAYENGSPRQAPPAPDLSRSGQRGQQAARTLRDEAAVQWRCWSSQDRIGLLAWVVDPKSSRLAGVEIELMDWLSRVIAELPQTAPEGLTCQLIDDAGHVFHQWGPGVDALVPNERISLAPELPHWQVLLYTNAVLPLVSRVFPWLAVLLVLGFAVTVLTGAALLIRDARRSRLDAERRTTFVSNISHELKTPLTTIRMYAELLHDQRVADASKRQHYLRVIMDESQRLTRLVGNVLNFGRLEQKRHTYQPDVIVLEPFVRSLIETLQPRVAAVAGEIQLAADAPGISVRMDRDALEQVLLNIIDNAIKYAARNGPIAVVVGSDARGPMVSVSDRGPGIPKHHRDRIFEAFHRVDDTLTTRHPGTGLGLSISRRLIEGCGGGLEFTPRDGGGSIFTIRLPQP